ncbi:MAG TPA: uridine diphosphate-N-acetylglucosamine-binding protein YvcK [Mycobacteriales bacterium]
MALGGGHGLATSLAALRQVTNHLTAVVTVADDGGSSGRLRAAYDLLPPGDLRMALAALAGTDDDSVRLRDMLQYRLPPGDAGLAGHPVGNLLLAGLLQTGAYPVTALATTGRMLGLPPGHQVLPMSTVPLDIEAEVLGLDAGGPVVVSGQVAVATTPGRVLAVRLVPPEAPACPEALTALAEADLIVLGPGSLFTSVLPHLIHPELGAAIAASPAFRVLVLNLTAQPGETEGFAPESHIEVLASHAPDLEIDLVVADVTAVLDRHGLMGGLTAAAEDVGARLHLAPLARRDRRDQHDPEALAHAFEEIVRGRLRTTEPTTVTGRT